MTIQRFHKNVPGPFYVVDGECIICGDPEHEAPDMIGYDEERQHCYFKKQPSTPEEIDRALRAVWVSCCQAVRYDGNDPNVEKRISERNGK